MSGLAETYLA